MQVKLVARITIAAEPAEIFKYLVVLKRHFLWNPHLQTISPLITLKQGSSYKTTSMMLGIQVSGVNKVTKYVPNEELELQNDAGALHYSVHYRLQPAGQRKVQLLCTTMVSSSNKAFLFTRPVFSMLARRELQTDLRALKIAIEQKLT